MVLSVTDILKILDQVPVWRTVRALPERLSALEDRVAQLEGDKAALTAQVPGEPCPACGARALRRTSSVTSKGPFGRLGARDEVWTCAACEQTDVREGVRPVR